MPPFCGLEDLEMSDISDPLLTSDSDVTGPGATLNNNAMNVDIDVLPASKSIKNVSCSSTQVTKSPAVALSGLFSLIEYASKSVLIGLMKHHNVQLPSPCNLEILRNLITSHLSGGHCAESDADGCMQLVSSFYVKSDVSTVLTKFIFQVQILLSIIYLVRLRPLRRILSCLHVSVESSMSFTQLQREFCECITRLNHGKRSEEARNLIIAQEKLLKKKKEEIQQNWPQPVPDTLKKKL